MASRRYLTAAEVISYFGRSFRNILGVGLKGRLLVSRRVIEGILVTFLLGISLYLIITCCLNGAGSEVLRICSTSSND